MAREDFRVAFGQRVREFRDQVQLSHERVAERAGLRRNYIGGIERGERNVEILNVVKLAGSPTFASQAMEWLSPLVGKVTSSFRTQN